MAFQRSYTSSDPLESAMRHVGFFHQHPRASSLPSVIDSPSHEPRFLKNHAGPGGRRHSAVRAHLKRITATTGLQKAQLVLSGVPLLSARLRFNKTLSTLSFFFFFPCCSLLCQGRGGGRDCLQQINISTHVSGPCVHRGG